MADLAESIAVGASAGRLYGLVSDLPRMGEWSPECTRVSWASGTPGPVVGARFVGHNRVGALRWGTQGRVVEAEPGRRFAFWIHFGPVPISLWAYEFAATADGCEVTESWTDRRPVVMRTVFQRVFGDRTRLNRRGIRVTLERLKAAAEVD
ncbi:SRPBCC family protein [Kribbella sp. NPDC050241]|uniref:SRPBCC family protein n=1 Tax=Kribbella sp. NPDC050241 TaxID=3364115 RepID=UPI0037B88426